MRHPLAVVVTIAGSMLALVLGLEAGGAFQALELAVYDHWVRTAAPASEGEDGPQVVIIELREQDLRDLGHWPVSDRVLGDALEQLSQSAAVAIGIDWYRDLPVPPGEAVLERALRADPRIVGVRKFGSPLAGGVAGPPFLERAGRVGFNDLPVDANGKASRRGLLFQDDGVNPVETSFSLRLVLLALAAAGEAPRPDPAHPEWIRLGPTSIPPLSPRFGAYAGIDAGGYQYMLDYARRDFPIFTFGQLQRGELDPGVLRGAVVLLGSNAESLPDLWSTPLGPRPGVHVHAHQVDQLLRYAFGDSRPLRSLSSPTSLAVTVLFTLVGCLAASGMGPVGRSPVKGAVGGLGFVGLFIVAAAVAFRSGWWIPVFPPVLGALAGGGLTAFWSATRERRDRAQLMGLFSRHVAPSVADDLWAKRDQFMDGGRPLAQRLDATVLFVDMVGSTAHAEKLDPAVLMEWSNRFMAAMAREVENACGVVDDYFGDGLKATFGVPVARTRDEEVAADAQRAVDCALAMARALRSLNQGNERDGLPTTAIRIGIDTGTVVAGSLGSSGRLKYTVMGDVVVTAARLEQTREIEHDFTAEPCRILISERTMARLRECPGAESLGRVAARGRSERIGVYRLSGVEPAGAGVSDRPGV